MAYAITTPISAGAGMRSEPVERDMCLNCELFDCVDCDQLDAMPEQGCCCGSIGPREDDSWDCGSGMCDPNTGCPSCSDEDRVWVRRS